MPPHRPRVSVLMPVLAPHPVYFPEAVASILRQTVEDIELVIVEDPSEQASTHDFGDARVRHIRNAQRTSLVDQRNRALAEARADVVALLDADDIAEPHRLAAQLELFAAHPEVGVAGSQLTIIDPTGDPIGTRAYPLEHDAIATAMCRYNAIAQPSVIARKQALLDAGGYRYRAYPVNEDYELWSRLIARGVRFANHPEPLVRYRVHPVGTKTAMLRRMLRATIDVKRRYWRERMSFGARLRFWAEHALLGLPPALVLKLFVATQYRRKPR